MISRSGQYGLRALVYLTQAGNQANVTAADVAAATGLPRNYLAKILNALVQAHVLDSTRGPHGGFRLSVPPADLSLSEALAPFHEADPGPCLLGLAGCLEDVDGPCRTRCRAITAAVRKFLDTTSIADLAGDREVTGSVRSRDRFSEPGQ